MKIASISSNPCLAGVGDILGVRFVEDLLRGVALLAVFGMNRNQDFAVLDLAFD